MKSVNRVAEHLAKEEGREEDSKLLRDFFTQKTIQEAIENNIVNHKKKVLFAVNSLMHVT